MRITEGMLAGSLLSDLQNVQESLLQQQSMLASGQRLQKPSDDPGGVQVALRLQGQLNDMSQYQANVQAGQGWLQSSDTALANATGVIQQLRALVVGAANGDLPPSALQATASQVQQLQGALLDAANAQFNGEYLFSGDQTQTPAFALNAGVYTYQGDSGQRRYQIGPTSFVTVNVTGNATFGNIFADIATVLNDLNTGNTAGLSNDLGNIDSDLNGLLNQRSVVGAALQRLTNAQSQLTNLSTATQQVLSGITSADVAKTIVDFQQQQQAYQLALAAGARLIQPTLLDFLH